MRVLVGTFFYKEGSLSQVMEEMGVRRFIFSSSATVYGNPKYLPLDEAHPVGQGLTNPYGQTKYFIEEVCKDLCRASPVSFLSFPSHFLTTLGGLPNVCEGVMINRISTCCVRVTLLLEEWNVILLRYFNPVGAHVSGEIGEDPKGIPNNLMPFVAQVASGKLPKVKVFGNDYDTPDGTGVRDYIHIVDLAKGHLAALRKIEQSPPGCKVGCLICHNLLTLHSTAYFFSFFLGSCCGVCRQVSEFMILTCMSWFICQIYNLGTGKGYSVLEMIKALSAASGREIPYEVAAKREGDLASVYCDPKLAAEELEWRAELGLEDMCASLYFYFFYLLLGGAPMFLSPFLSVCLLSFLELSHFPLIMEFSLIAFLQAEICGDGRALIPTASRVPEGPVTYAQGNGELVPLRCNIHPLLHISTLLLLGPCVLLPSLVSFFVIGCIHGFGRISYVLSEAFLVTEMRP